MYVLGRYNLDTYFGNDTIYTVGSMDIFLAKYTSDGNYQWVEHYGSVNEDNALRMDMFSNGDLLLTGFFNKRIEFREDTIYSNGADDLFLTRLLPNGEPVWSLNAGGIGNDRANSVFIDNNDNILLTGQYEIGAYFEDFYLESLGYMDAFLAKYNQDGNLVWTQGFNGSIYEQGSDVAADDNGNIYLSAWFISEVSIGDTMLTTNSLYDSFILKTDSDGNPLWIEQITGPGDEKVLSLSVTGNDSLYFTGVYTDTVFINNDTLTNKGWNDLFYARMLPEIILESPLAVNASELITFYPNPASNQVFIEIEHPSIIYLHDISGKAIQQFEFYKDGFIDVSGIKNGLYFLTVQSDRSKKPRN